MTDIVMRGIVLCSESFYYSAPNPLPAFFVGYHVFIWYDAYPHDVEVAVESERLNIHPVG